MKWTLDIEKRRIDMSIQNNRFTLRTKKSKVEFDLNMQTACEMFGYTKGVLELDLDKIAIGKVERLLGDKKLVLFFHLVPGNQPGISFWEMNLISGDSTFSSQMSWGDIGKFAQVLSEYLKKATIPVNVHVREGCPYCLKLLQKLENKGFEYNVRYIDAQNAPVDVLPVLFTIGHLYSLPDFFDDCDLDLFNDNLLNRLFDDLNLFFRGELDCLPYSTR